MPESMSPSLAATRFDSIAVSPATIPPRNPETSLSEHSKPLIRHPLARLDARRPRKRSYIAPDRWAMDMGHAIYLDPLSSPRAPRADDLSEASRGLEHG
jgi:hypothetical protein